MRGIQWFFILTFISWSSFATAQVSPKDVKAKAEEFYNFGKYRQAIPLLLKYQEFEPEDIGVKTWLGISYLKISKPERAKAFLTYVAKDKRADDQVYRYLGEACQMNNEFEQAIRYYKLYLGKMRMKDPFREGIKDDIKRCVIGRKILYRDEVSNIENISEINTEEDEFSPLIPRIDEAKLYFATLYRSNMGGMLNEQGFRDTMKGRPRADIYVSDLTNDLWENTRPVNIKYNTRKHDILYDFNRKGNLMHVYRSESLDNGDVYSTLVNEEEEIASYKLFPSPINTKVWEGDFQFFNDSIVLFSSDRPGGFGGKDLYISIYSEAVQEWSEPKNVGAPINTEFDEISPFLCINGRTLYYSSNNLRSIGGHDIFSASYIDSSATWTKPYNLGIPINSGGDDAYFKITQNGLKAVFSSERPNGAGGQDLYVAYFRRYLTEQLQYSSPLVFSQVVMEVPEIVAPEPVEEEPIVEETPVLLETEPETPTPVETISSIPEKTRTVRFAPINYKVSDQSLSPTASATLRNLTDLMKEFPELKVILFGHSDSRSTLNDDIYFAAKRAGDMAKFMVNEGVEAENITVIGCGANYPQAINKNENGTSNPLGKVLNRRVEIKLYNTQNTPIQAEVSEPVISSMIMRSEAIQFRQKVKGLSYRVQIKSTKNRFDNEVLERYDDVVIEASPDSPYVHTCIGLTKRFNDADRLRLKLAEEGFEEAFVVPYINGVRITKEAAQTLKVEFPDLVNFLTATATE